MGILIYQGERFVPEAEFQSLEKRCELYRQAADAAEDMERAAQKHNEALHEELATANGNEGELRAALRKICTRIPPSESNEEANWRWKIAYNALREIDRKAPPHA